MSKQISIDDIFKKRILENLYELKDKKIKEIYNVYGEQDITILTEDNCYLHLEMKTVSDGWNGSDNIIYIKSKDDIIKDIEIGAYDEYNYLFEDGVLDYDLYRKYVDEIYPKIEEELKRRKLNDRMIYLKNQISGMSNELKKLENEVENNYMK